MNKICPLCLTVYEDDDIEYCPKCKQVYDNMPNNIQKMMGLKDYNEYNNNMQKLEDPSSIERKRLEKMMSQIQTQNNADIHSSNIPKCPTCGSTNIEKISSLNKAAGAVMFGLFSKTAKSQFKCNNCGYKW